MGLSTKKSSSTQTNRPVYEREIRSAADTLTNTYNQQQPRIQEYSDMIGGLTSGLIERYQNGDPAVNAARDYVTSTLSADPQNNPYLDEMVGLTNDNTRRAIQTQLGTRGGIGGSAERDIVSRALSNNELGMRYQDYDAQQGRRAQAAGMANQVVAGDLMTLAPAMATAEFGAMMPMNAAQQYAAGTGGLLGQYQNVNSTQRSTPSIMDSIGQAVQIGSMFSDERLKEGIRQVGKTDGGLPVYTYRYKGGDVVHMGVMAQEVAEHQPDALGPVVQGYGTVNYAEVR